MTTRVTVTLPVSVWLEVHHALWGALDGIGAYGEFQSEDDESAYRMNLESAFNAVVDAINESAY